VFTHNLWNLLLQLFKENFVVPVGRQQKDVTRIVAID